MIKNKILNLIVGLFILYAIFNNSLKTTHAPEIEPHKEHENQTLSPIAVSIKPKNPDSFIENKTAQIMNHALNSNAGQQVLSSIMGNSKMIDKRVLPKLYQDVRFNDLKPGTGYGALCGQEVQITYVANSNQTSEISLSQEKSLIFTLGQGSAPKIFEIMALGMKAGGQREVAISQTLSNEQNLLYKEDINPSGETTLRVNLTSITNPLQQKLRVYDEETGYGEVAKCGDKININYQIFSFDGSLIHNQNLPINIKIGDSSNPSIFNFALDNFALNGSKVIISPASLLEENKLKNIDKSLPASIKFSKDKMMIIEVKRVAD